MSKAQRIAAVLGLLAAVAGPGLAQRVGGAYVPAEQVRGKVRIWGAESMAAVVAAWELGFRRYQPAVTFETKLMGTATAMPGLYSGLADLALLGRESNVTDNDGFLHSLQYRPVEFKLMTGSLDAAGKAYALVIYVHKDNPLRSITLAQLDGLFGCEHRRGGKNLRTGGELGLTGEWKDKPVALYGYDAESGTGRYFARAVLGGSRKLNWAAMHEFKDARRRDGSRYESGRQIVDALQKDRFGLAVSGLQYGSPELKVVPVARGEDQAGVAASAATVVGGSYPLRRMTYAFVNQPRGKPMDAGVHEFLRYVFSAEGQAEVAKLPGYLPLSAAELAAQREKLR